MEVSDLGFGIHRQTEVSLEPIPQVKGIKWHCPSDHDCQFLGEVVMKKLSLERTAFLATPHA
jgi:hypothetical protein